MPSALPLYPLDLTTRSSGRPRDARLDPILLEAAVDVLYAKGYNGLTMGHVARQSGVSTATVYRRWANKRELIHDVALNLSQAMLPPRNTGAFESDLRAILLDKISVLNGRLGTVARVLTGEAAHDRELARLLEEVVRSSLGARLRMAIELANLRGEIKTPPFSDAVVDIIAGPVLMRLLFGAKGSDELSPALVDELLPFFLRALGAQPA